MTIRRTSNKETMSVAGWLPVDDVDNKAGLEFSLAVKDGESIVAFGAGGFTDEVAESSVSDEQILAAVREKLATHDPEGGTLREFVRLAEGGIERILRSCPFCGSESLTAGRRDGVAYVDCAGCRISVDFWTSTKEPEFDVAAAWNRRGSNG